MFGIPYVINLFNSCSEFRIFRRKTSEFRIFVRAYYKLFTGELRDTGFNKYINLRNFEYFIAGVSECVGCVSLPLPLPHLKTSGIPYTIFFTTDYCIKTFVMKNEATKLTFIRSISTTDKDGQLQSSLICQPYCVGMYVAITVGGNTIQLSFSYKKYSSWAKQSIKLQEKNGYTVVVHEEKLIDFLSEEDIKEYIIK